MWHAECIDRMVDRAAKELKRLGVADLQIHRLPGSLELPAAARALFEVDTNLDGILAFGVVLKGATSHDSTVIQQVLHGFGLISDRFGKPIINEVIGVANIEDAIKRSQDNDWNKGLEAAFAISEFLSWQRKIHAK
jgi:6,7-dimethyl-8-ribityllumazine synthase